VWLCSIVGTVDILFMTYSLHIELNGWYITRVGQNRICAYIYTVFLVISKPKIPYVHRIYMVLANPIHNYS